MDLIRTRRRTLLGLALMSLTGTACADWLDSGDWGGSSGSKSVATDEIYAELLAQADGSGSSEVQATLGISPSLRTTLVLNGGDRLNATSVDPVLLDEEEKVLRKRKDGGDRWYSRSFQIGGKDTLFEVALDRGGSRVSAPDSFATLPAPFVLDWVDDTVALTLAPEPFSRSSATPYYVVWDPFDAPDFEPGDEPGDELDYEVTGDCIETFQGALDWEAGGDALQLTGVLPDRPPPDDGMSCPLRVEIRLGRMGTLDPAFLGGSFWGEQLRVLELDSTP
jgi:hypothetical protein